MSTILYHCSNCKKPIDRHEQVKVHREGDELFFFHTSCNCFIQWEAWRKNIAFYRAQSIAREFAEENVL